VERKDFVKSIRLSGIVEAMQSYSVLAPRMPGRSGWGELTITKLAPSGTRVKVGDLLVEFDRQVQIQNFLDTEREYLQKIEQIKKQKAIMEAARARDDTELHQAENAVGAAKWEIQKNEVIARIDAEINQQNLEEAEAKLKQLRTTYDLKRKAAAAQLKIYEIQSEDNRISMEFARENTEKMLIRAKMEGIVVLNHVFKGQSMAEIQEGDTVNPGRGILQLVNTSQMQVRSRVNQADFLFLHLDQEAKISLDAYPGLSFRGRLMQVAPIGVASGLSNRIRTFTALFSLEGADPRLMPDLSAAMDIEVERIPNVVVIPREAVIKQEGKFFVQVLHNNNVELRPVNIGPRSDMEAIVEAGVNPGEVLLLNRPTPGQKVS
jgi:multidrug efflux pump subunit AcrA (membrane-fusion protein)